MRGQSLTRTSWSPFSLWLPVGLFILLLGASLLLWWEAHELVDEHGVTHSIHMAEGVSRSIRNHLVERHGDLDHIAGELSEVPAATHVERFLDEGAGIFERHPEYRHIVLLARDLTVVARIPGDAQVELSKALPLPPSHAALSAALREVAEPRTTRPFADIEGDPAILLFEPIVSSRPDADQPIGFVAAEIELKSVLSAARAQAGQQSLSVHVVVDEQVVPGLGGVTPAHSPEALRELGATETLSLFGRAWRISSAPLPGGRIAQQHAENLQRLVLAVVLAALACVLLHQSRWRGRQIRAQLRELEHVYTRTPIGLGLCDAQHRFLRINPTLAEMIGRPMEACLGRTIRELTPKLADHIEPIHARVLETGRPMLDVETHGVTPAQPEMERDWVSAHYPVEMTGGGRAVGAVVREVTQAKRQEAALQRLMHDLNERVKELRCLYAIARILEEPAAKTEETLRQIVDLIPPAFEFPEDTCARIVLGESDVQTPGFAAEGHSCEAAILRDGVPAGRIVVYRRAAPPSDRPFLREEEDLLIAVAEQLGRVVDRQRAAAAVATERQRLLTVLEQLPGYVCLQAGDHTIRFANRYFRDAFGDPSDWRCDDPENLPDQPCHPRETDRVFATGQPHEWEWTHPDTARTYRAFNYPMTDVDGTPLVLELGIDVTARRRMEAELDLHRHHLEMLVRERTAALTALNKELEAFCYSVSHDLRAPLRHMEGFSRALLEDQTDRLDERGRQYLDYIRDSSAEMAHLIDALLDLSRVTRADLQRERVDVSRLAAEVVDELRATTPEHAVDVHIAPGLVADADPRLLRIVLANLLSNAWKFTRHTPQPRVVVEHVERHGWRPYCVRDNGAGFDPRYADRLFMPFQRLHAEAEFAGSGIGLATVQRIIHRHGGRLWAEGTPGAGAAFFFTVAAETDEADAHTARRGDSAPTVN